MSSVPRDLPIGVPGSYELAMAASIRLSLRIGSFRSKVAFGYSSSASPQGSGKGELHILTEMQVGRPVIIPSLFSTVYNDHQTRLRISLETLVTDWLLFFKFIPSDTAERIAKAEILHALFDKLVLIPGVK
jgi:hypothetical protein